MALDSAIKDGLITLGLKHTETFISKLEAYLVLLSRWNRVTNISGIKKLTDMVSLHLMDSLSVHAYLEGKTILDGGSGAVLVGREGELLDAEDHIAVAHIRDRTASRRSRHPLSA